MNEVEYKAFYDRVGKLNGWDFRSVRCVTEGETWDFYREVSQRCKKSDVLLDIGTGGGENVLSITDAALFLVGIDISSEMVSVAHENLLSSGKSNLRFLKMDAERLEFPEQFFNVISCRQSPFSAQEAARVLTNDGVFLTQQVSENDKLNLTEVFGRGRAIYDDGTLKKTYIAELRAAGFHEIQAFDYDATEYFHSYEDLIFLLKHTPIIPNFGQMENDFALLNTFIEDNRTNEGIKTNSKRFMIIARK